MTIFGNIVNSVLIAKDSVTILLVYFIENWKRQHQAGLERLGSLYKTYLAVYSNVERVHRNSYFIHVFK